MNFTVVAIAAVALGVGGFYAKGQLDGERRIELARVVAEKASLEADILHQRSLQRKATAEAMAARKVQIEKETEANDLRKELAERKTIAACSWTPSQRNRLRKITIGKPAGTTPRT